MILAYAVALLLGAFVCIRCADFAHRVLSDNMVALAFAEGGDDGYYVLTIARNLAAGRGLTVDGWHWTTGFHPLWELLCGAAFLSGSDRVAFATVYALSVGCWLVSSILVVEIVERAIGRRIDRLARMLVVALFLCNASLSGEYVNGLETGLYLTLCLGLFLAFQARLEQPSVSMRHAVMLGVLSGLTMLARNDGVFICAGFLGATLLAFPSKRSVKEGMVIVLVATVLVLPWLAYCMYMLGWPMPQSGVATSAALREQGPEISAVISSLAKSLVPALTIKVRTLLGSTASAVAVAAVAVAGAIAWRRRLFPHVSRSFKLTSFGYAMGCVGLVTYYVTFSWASFFFERYFAPIELLVALLVSLAVARAADGARFLSLSRGIVCLVATLAIASNIYWVVRDFSLPYRGYMGEEAFTIGRSPYAHGSTRLGLAESGRLGFLYPDRVVNLDGKMRIDALRALRHHTLNTFLQDARLDYVILHGHDTEFFDKISPQWRSAFREVGKFTSFQVFAPINGADR